MFGRASYRRDCATGIVSLTVILALAGCSSALADGEEIWLGLALASVDVRPQLSLHAVWREYWLEILALALVLAALLGLALVLYFKSLRLRVLLRRVEELSAIIRRSPVVAMAWSNAPGWPMSFVSDSIGQFGYRQDDFLSGTIRFDSLIHPQDLPRIESEVSGYIENGPDEYVQEYRLRHGDGRWIWVVDYTWLTRDAAGQVTAIDGILLDVTERKVAEQREAHARALMQYIIEHNNAAVAVHDRDLNYVFVSQKYLDSFGLVRQDVIGKHHYEVFPELPQKLKDVHPRVLRGEVVSADEDLFEHPDGRQDWTRWECRPWLGVDGSIGGLIVYTEIITDRKQAELALRAKTEALASTNARLQQLAAVFTHAREGIFICEPDGRIVEVNKAFSRITGYSRSESIGRNPSFLRSGRHGPEFFADLWQQLEQTGYWSGEIWNRRKSGEIYPQAAAISAVRNDAGEIVQYVALFTDVTEEKRSERQLQYVSQYDVLTGLPNRKLLTDRLRQAMAQCRKNGRVMAVVFLDLDGFKHINDQHGDEVGDAALSALGRRLRGRVRGGDMVGRIGGDELVVLLTDLETEDSALPLIETLRAGVADPLQLEDHEIQLSASLGVSFYPQTEEVDADQLLRQADQAMYQAKLAGKNRHHLFSPEKDQATRGLHETLQRIRRGLEHHEFVLYYQPKVNMRSGQVLGAEALIRWQHPERGLLPPAQFLPLVEKRPLALELGHWVIDQALEQLANWQAEGLELTVSVNVFGLQLQQPDFIDRLRAALARHPHLQARQLEIEILETSALEDVDQVSRVIRECQSLGIRCALDDFGTGYSTLSYLKQLPASVLKIDQSFVRDMLDDPDDLAILNGILGLCRVFQREPIAEGVETVAHGEALLDLGCHLGQGYGIARPMPAAKIAAWVRNWRPSKRWRDRRQRGPEELHLLFATVEHRAWVVALARHVEQGSAPPVMETESCEFGRWLQRHRKLFVPQPGLSEQLMAQHAQVHERAEKIIEQVASGHPDKAASELEKLYRDRDALLELLASVSPSFEAEATAHSGDS